MRQSFFKRFFFPFCIFLITAFIAFTTYKPGTFLTGWDTLHPEFDLSLNFQRLINGVWREEQGLGALAGHSHMADLPRVVILWLLHFFLPLNTLRYAYMFFCLVLGPLGIYYLISYMLTGPALAPPNRARHLRAVGIPPLDHPSISVVAFLSALFYTFNLGTVQQFYAPFEMFPTQYAALPWIMLYSLKVLKEPSKKNLLLFSTITLLSTPQAYAAHLWYAFFGVYILFLFTLVILGRRKTTTPESRSWTSQDDEKGVMTKRATILIAITLLVNSFWLLPNLYYITTTSSVPKESKQNRIYSQEYRLRNREHGYLQDAALLKGFYLSWSVYDFDRETFQYLMPSWRDHINSPYVLIVGYLFFTGVLLGIFHSFQKKQFLYLAFLPFFIVPMIFLLNHTFPFDLLFDALSKLPLFEEALRFVFTKFSILLLFGYTVFLSLTIFTVFSLLSQRKRLLLLLVLIFFLVVNGFPLLKGGLISDKFKISIPKEYFDFWSHMKKKEDGVVLTLPLHTFSGWQYYDWGYQGAGFLWFGLKQPVLDRDFDRWSRSNERAFRELQYTLYIRDADLFTKTLEKFNVKYIVWDKSVVSSGTKNRQQVLFFRETEDLLRSLFTRGKILQESRFGKIVVFKVRKTPFLSGIKKLPAVSPAYQWNFEDSVYKLLGPYVSGEGYTFPFRDIVTATDHMRSDLFAIDRESSSYFLKSSLSQHAELMVPDIWKTEEVFFADLYVENLQGTYRLLFKPILPKAFIENIVYPLPERLRIVKINGKEFGFGNVELEEGAILYLGQIHLYTKEINRVNGLPVSLAQPKQENIQDVRNFFGKFPLAHMLFDARYLEETNSEKGGIIYDRTKNVLRFSTENKQSGVAISLTDLPHTTGYILGFKSRNIDGLPLRICFKNLYSGLCSLYDELSKSKTETEDYFIVPPTENGIGYSLSIDNISYGGYESKNELNNVVIIPFPYRFLSNIYIKKAAKTRPVIIFPSSYHQGWSAYTGGKKLEHVLVNNWANGWIVPATIEPYNNMTIRIVFWPQYLEYAGFGFLIVTFAVIFLKQKWN